MPCILKSGTAGTHVPRSRSSSMTHVSILLVDDDRELDQMLTEYLSAEGFRVAIALDGAAALKRLAEETFDLAILDVMLP